MKSTAIFILNVARSGSSVLAGILDKLDIYGGNDFGHPNIYNPRGFFESKKIVNIHNEILNIWDKMDSTRNIAITPPVDWHKAKEIEQVKERLTDILKTSYITHELWYLKEPNLMRLLPLYFDLSDELGFDIKICFLFRQPLEVAYSMRQYNQRDINQNSFIWLKSNLEAENATRNLQRVFLSYNSLMSDWETQIKKISLMLNLNISFSNKITAGRLLNPIYRSYNIDSFDDLSSPFLAETLSKTYTALQSFEFVGDSDIEVQEGTRAISKKNKSPQEIEMTEDILLKAAKIIDDVNAAVLNLEKNAPIINGKKTISVPTQPKMDKSRTINDAIPLVFKDSILYLEPDRLTDDYTWHAHIPLAFWLIENLKPKTIVELGVYKGDAYFAFCQAVKYSGLSNFTKCIGIETYKKPENQEINSNKPSEKEVFDDVLRYNETHYKDFSTLVKRNLSNGFNVTLKELKVISPQLEKIDILHFNGISSYEMLKSNFERLEPHLSENSIVLVHFITPKTNEITAWKFYEEISQIYPSISFNIDFGLGMLLVGKESQKHPSISKFVLYGYNYAVNIFNHAGIRLAINRDKRTANIFANHAEFTSTNILNQTDGKNSENNRFNSTSTSDIKLG